MRITIETDESHVSVSDPGRNDPSLTDGGSARDSSRNSMVSLMAMETDAGSPPTWLVDEIGKASSQGAEENARSESETPIAADGGRGLGNSESKD